MKSISKIVLLLVLCLNYVVAHQNSFGVGAFYSTTPYIKQSNTLMAVPVVNYTYKNVYIKGFELGYYYNHFFQMILKPRMGTHDIQGVQSAHESVDIGAKLSYKVYESKLEFELLGDTFSIHNGYEANFKLSKTIVYDRYIVIPNISFTYQESNLANYYYGVEKNQQFAYYDTGSTIDSSIGFVGIYNFHPKYALNLIAKKTFLDTDKYSSPIVEKSSKEFFMLSAVYKF